MTSELTESKIQWQIFDPANSFPAHDKDCLVCYTNGTHEFVTIASWQCVGEKDVWFDENLNEIERVCVFIYLSDIIDTVRHARVRGIITHPMAADSLLKSSLKKQGRKILKKMTKEEFESFWMSERGLGARKVARFLKENNMECVRCDCEKEYCKGWVMNIKEKGITWTGA
jgi:hypothetical protein